MTTKRLASILLFAVIVIGVPGAVFAALDCNSSTPCSNGCPLDSSGDCPSSCIPNPLRYSSFECLIDAIIKIIFYISLALAPVMIIIGAFQLMTSAGNPVKV
ncbi:MAG: hypothetical protein Q8N56_01810, partial [bacterium]|nr:hypothetical protein [bacterium]